MKKYAYNEDLNKKVKIEWDNFINGRTVNEDNVRKKIYDSWKRSKENNINPDNFLKHIITSDEIDARVENNAHMCRIALPFMKEIFNIISGSNSIVLLTDNEGYALKIFADDVIGRDATSNQFVEGANRNESVAGTNAIGTCLYLDETIQVYGEEHFALQNKTWACSAAPIHDKNKKILGALNVSVQASDVHNHTLGMVIASAKAIQNEIYLQDMYDEMAENNSRLMATLESFTDAVILLDMEGRVSQINLLAREMLGWKERDVIGRHLNVLIKYDTSKINLEQLREDFTEKEMMFKIGKYNERFFISAKLAKPLSGSSKSVVITIKAMERIRNLVNKVASHGSSFCFEDIVGSSEIIKESIHMAILASKSPSNVLITGESGTGKEMFAQSIHQSSSRQIAPFIAINCAAMPKGLIESELFGYESGAFTGARKDGKPGKFELASGGTIFLDEIGDMPLDVQAALLRVIQNREVTRIGGNKLVPVDIRIIAATNINLEEAVIEKTFRKDLYYRLNVLQINIAPLRDRKKDIRELAEHFLNRYITQLKVAELKIEDEGYEVLENYSWPGNARELENIIERVVNFAEDSIVSADVLRKYIYKVAFKALDLPKQEANEGKDALSENKDSSIKEMEKDIILRMLKKNKGNVKKTADQLGIGRRTLYRKFETFHIDYKDRINWL